MRDYDLSLSLATALLTSPDLAAPVGIFAHGTRVEASGDHDNPEITLPAILIESKSEPLASSVQIARATVEITIESQIDDDPPELHDARCTAVATVMADQAGLLAAFDARNTIRLLGKPCPTQTNPEIEQRAAKTVLTWRLGYAVR